MNPNSSVALVIALRDKLRDEKNAAAKAEAEERKKHHEELQKPWLPLLRELQTVVEAFHGRLLLYGLTNIYADPELCINSNRVGEFPAWRAYKLRATETGVAAVFEDKFEILVIEAPSTEELLTKLLELIATSLS